MELLRSLHAAGNSIPAECSYEAARGGHIETLKWTRQQGCYWNSSICEFAAEDGKLEVLKFARANGCNWDEKKICEAAASGGHLEVQPITPFVCLL